MFHGLAGGINQARHGWASSAIRRQMLGRIGAVSALMAMAIGLGFCGMGPAWGRRMSRSWVR